MLADKLPITGPCPIDLDAIGFDRSSKVSHCTHCVKSVTNLSNMTQDEAREFLREHKGEKLCVSYACDGAGKIRFRSEPEPALVPVTALRPRKTPALQPVATLPPRKASRAAGFVAALGVSAALAACAPHGEPPRDVTVEGKMTVPNRIDEPRRDVTVEGKMTVPDRIDEPTKPIAAPDPVPMGGAVVIPEDVMMDGEMAVPDPDVLDEPCDKTKARGKDTGKPDTTESIPIPKAGMAVIPQEVMMQGGIDVPDSTALEEPTHARTLPRR
jgi:hypothetical protein